MSLIIFRSFLRLLCVSFPSLEGILKEELSTQQIVHDYKKSSSWCCWLKHSGDVRMFWGFQHDLRATYLSGAKVQSV